MILRLFFALNSIAFGQAFDTFVFHPGKHAAYGREKLSIDGFPDYPLVKEDLKVSMKPGAPVYSSEEYAKNPNAVAWIAPISWKQKCDAQDSAQETSGKLLYATEAYAVIQTDSPTKRCGRFFNNAVMKDNVVFVHKNDVATIVPRTRSGPESKSEAAFDTKVRDKDKKCEVCELAKKDDALRMLYTKAKANLVYTGPEKSVTEQERYFACYKTPHQENYNQYYKKLFEVAAKVFQVTFTAGPKGQIKPMRPEDYESTDHETGGSASAMVGSDSGLMKCVGLRESSWNPLTVSNTGAKGIGQQTGENIEHINCLIRGCTRMLPAFKEGKPLKDKAGKPILVEKEIEARPWAQDMWTRYFTEVKKISPPKVYNHLMTNPKTGQPCLEEMGDKDRDAPCPINSIGALALYHVVAELQMRRSSPLYKGENERGDFSKEGERLSFKITRGATTNAGTGSLQKTMKKYENPNDWPRFIGPMSGRNKEVGNYVRFLTNCLEAGNMKPYFDVKKKDGVDNKGRPLKQWTPPDCNSPEVDRAVDEIMTVK